MWSRCRWACTLASKIKEQLVGFSFIWLENSQCIYNHVFNKTHWSKAAILSKPPKNVLTAVMLAAKALALALASGTSYNAPAILASPIHSQLSYSARLHYACRYSQHKRTTLNSPPTWTLSLFDVSQGHGQLVATSPPSHKAASSSFASFAAAGGDFLFFFCGHSEYESHITPCRLVVKYNIILLNRV